jgi:Leucine-rich repeat (LRR) protein
MTTLKTCFALCVFLMIGTWMVPLRAQDAPVDYEADQIYEDVLRLIEEARVNGATRLNLAGHCLKNLPPEIGHLTSLEELDLSSNHIPSLPPEIGQLTHLRVLDLSHNGMPTLAPEIGQLNALQYLKLNGNSSLSCPLRSGVSLA